MAEALLPIATTSQVLRVLRSHLKRRWAAVCAVLMLFLFEAATALVFPFVIGQIVSGVTSGAKPATLLPLLGALAGSAVLSGALAWLGTRSLARILETVIAELREDFVESALNLPRAQVEAAGVGDVVTRASDDIAQISESLPTILPRLSVSLFTLALVATTLIAIDPRYLIAFLIAAPAYALTLRAYLRRAPHAYMSLRAAQSARSAHVLETLTQAPTVIWFGFAGHQLRVIQEATWRVVKWAMRTRIMQNRLFGGLNLAEAVGLAAVLAIGVWLSFEGAADAASVTTAALLYLRTVAPIDSLLFLMDDLQQSVAALARIIGVQTSSNPATVEDPPNEAGDAQCLVELCDVSFSYGDVPVVEGVSLTIAAGETVALVGASGAGKSTLAALMAGVYAPTRGRIHRRVASERIATATQEVHVFAATLRDNLTIAIAPSPAARACETDEAGGSAARADFCTGECDTRLRESLERVGALELIDSLPHGLDTVVGHGGVDLTAAQQQLLALARVHLADPTLVILDESTAEADAADTMQLDRAVAAVIEGRAAVLIAHRLAQAQSADRIIVLERGRAVETGTHEQLLQFEGRYARFHASQSRATGAQAAT